MRMTCPPWGKGYVAYSNRYITYGSSMHAEGPKGVLHRGSHADTHTPGEITKTLKSRGWINREGLPTQSESVGFNRYECAVP